MAWNDAPPTAEELASVKSAPSWDKSPPTEEERALFQEKGAKPYQDPRTKMVLDAAEYLPAVGTIAGDVAGAISPIPGGTILGGGAGGAAGEAAKEALKNYIGPKQEDLSPIEMAKQGAIGAGSVLVPKVLGKGLQMAAETGPGQAAAEWAMPKIAAAKDAISNAAIKALAKTSGALSSTPSDAVEQLLRRPGQVMGAPENTMGLAKQMGAEIEARDALESEKIIAARDRFRAERGGEIQDTLPMLKKQEAILAKMAPTEEGLGPLSPEEIKQLSSLDKRGLLTRQRTYPENNSSRVLTQEPVIKDRLVQKEISGQPFEGFDRQVVSKDAPLQGLNRGLEPQGYSDRLDPLNRVQDVPRYGKETVLAPKVTEPQTVAYDASLHEKSAGELQKYADDIQSKITSWRNSGLPGQKDTRYSLGLKARLGAVKDALHKMDPEGLGAADIHYTNYAEDADMLHSFVDSKRQEGAVSNYYGKNKTAVQNAAKNIAPNSQQDLKDLMAWKAFQGQGTGGTGRGLRNLISLGAGAKALQDPAYLALATAVQPAAQMQILGRGSQAFQAMSPWAIAAAKKAAPYATTGLVDQATQDALKSKLNPWSQNEQK